MIDAGIPIGNGTVEILGVDVGERTEIEIPLVRVVRLEIEVRVLVLISLLQDGVFEVVALAERSIAVIVVVHPLIDGRGLLADSLERGVWVEKSEGGGQTVVGN